MRYSSIHQQHSSDLAMTWLWKYVHPLTTSFACNTAFRLFGVRDYQFDLKYYSILPCRNAPDLSESLSTSRSGVWLDRSKMLILFFWSHSFVDLGIWKYPGFLLSWLEQQFQLKRSSSQHDAANTMFHCGNGDHLSAPNITFWITPKTFYPGFIRLEH